MKPTLPALLAASLVLAIALAATAGTAEDPEMGDGVDDVDVNGACSGGFGSVPPCPSMDFLWPNVDIQAGFVDEDAANLLLHLVLKSTSGFKGTQGFSFDYVLTFQLEGATYTATAAMDSAGAITAGGNATSAVATANALLWTVPKAAVGAHRGDLLTGLFVTAHGEAAAGDFVLDDRAPDANVGRDYQVQSGPTRIAYHALGATPAAGNLTRASRVDIYNWTATTASADFDFAVTATNGTLQARVQDGAGTTLFTGNATTEKVLTGKPGNWTVTLTSEGFTGSYELFLHARPATTGTATGASGTPSGTSTGPAGTATGTGTGTAPPTGTTTEPAPALSMAALGLAVALLAARRRR
ncbi:MAG: hypothetical protein QOD77_1585 [Thermoplasmata archaeon]|jgi:hypothetical protein|nr:hypothetical protein [Thermoplasmata archaeon]